MGSIVLDSTVLIDFLRRRLQTVWRVSMLQQTGDVPYVSPISVEEIVRGLRPREEEAARALFEGLHPAPLGTEEGWRAGTWRRTFAKKGKSLAQADCLIAASAFSLGARLGTGNPKDFPMSDIQVEHWPVGE